MGIVQKRATNKNLSQPFLITDPIAEPTSLLDLPGALG